MTKTEDIQLINKWLEVVDDDSFIKSISMRSPTYIDPDTKGIYFYHINDSGTVDIVIVNTDRLCPGILFHCCGVSSVHYEIDCDVNVIIEQDYDSMKLYLNGKHRYSFPIICKRIEAEILNIRCWQENFTYEKICSGEQL